MLKLLNTLTSHKGKVWSVSWNPAGTAFASCGEDKNVNIYQGDDGSNSERPVSEALKWSLAKQIGTNHERTIRDVAWSPCGKYLAVASFDATITIWEKGKSNEYECVTTVEGHENEVKSVSWSPSGQYFASCSRDKNVMVWSMSTDGEYDIECESVLSTHTQDVKRVMWHPTEDILVSASYDDTLRLYRNDPNDEDWTSFAVLQGHESTVWSLDFDVTGNRIVSASDDRSIRIWTKVDEEGTKWSCVSKLEGYHNRPVYDVSWNKTNGLIATACGDDSIRIFKEAPAVSELEKNSFDLAFTIKAHTADVNRVQWNPKADGILLSCGDDSTVKIWSWVDI